MTPAGTLNTVYNFCAQSGCTDGYSSDAALVQAPNGDFYGTTFFGGAHNNGTVFELSPGGALTTLYSFCSKPACTDGISPGALIQGAGGEFYGVTSSGGTAPGDGTIFRISPAGALTTLESFDGADGANPSGALVQDVTGNLYGATYQGGSVGAGTIFQLTPGGALTTLYSFCTSTSMCQNGAYPGGGLVKGGNEDFYGTTTIGGAFSAGTIFKVSNSGVLAVLYNFCPKPGCADGSSPGALIRASDGNFYGTAFGGGDRGYGTVFRMTPGGAFTRVYSFCSQSECADGAQPVAGLVQATNGNFYGTTYLGGGSTACPYGCGTVFSLSIGLR